MGDCTVENTYRKRAREFSAELEPNSPQLKRTNTNTYSDPNPSESQRVIQELYSNSPESGVVDSVDELDSAEARLFQENILDILDDTDTEPVGQDLDSVMRSFEEEILYGSPSATQPAVIELTSDSGEYQPDLGFLLGASDDELGLPPTGTSSKILQTQDEPVKTTSLGNWFEDDLQSYDDPFGLGFEEKPIERDDFVAVDELFDYSESADLAWRPESLPAL